MFYYYSMFKIIEINYISVISDYNFNSHPNDKYYLAFINLDINGNVIINQISIPRITNATNSIIANAISKSIQYDYNTSGMYKVHLFSLNLATSYISLLFSGRIDVQNIINNKCVQFVLYQPAKVNNQYLRVPYNGDLAILSSVFNMYESVDSNNKCTCYITIKNKLKYPIVPRTIYKYDISQDVFIFDRYNYVIMKDIHEIGLNSISSNANSHTVKSYLNLVTQYQIDLTRYLPVDDTIHNDLSLMTMRRIKPNYRKLYVDDYANNILTTPSDGNYLAFGINAHTRLTIQDMHIPIGSIIKDMNTEYNGAGLVARLSNKHYQRITVPYNGYLAQVGIFNDRPNNVNDKSTNSTKYHIVLRFINNYFVPPHVHERDNLSAIYGHNTNMSRYYPELIKVQEKTPLDYYVILFGNSNPASIQLTNAKLSDIKNKITVGTMSDIRTIYFDQGEDIGAFNMCEGYIMMLMNRPMRFTSDLNFYSKLVGNHLSKPIETYIKQNDIAGYIL